MELCKWSLSNIKGTKMKARIIPTRQNHVPEKGPDVLKTSPYGPICNPKESIGSGTLMYSTECTQDVNLSIIHKIQHILPKIGPLGYVLRTLCAGWVEAKTIMKPFILELWERS